MIYNIKIYIFIIFLILITKNVFAYDFRIIVKVNNEIITNLDISNYAKYLDLLNPKFSN